MKNLRPETLGILLRIETLSGRPVELKPDSRLLRHRALTRTDEPAMRP